MAMDMDLFNRRMAEANEALIKAYQSADPTADDYLETLKVIQAIHQQINADCANCNDIDIEVKKALIDEANSKRAFMGDIGKTAGAVLAAVLGFLGIAYSEKHLDRRFDRSTRFEQDDALLTTTSKETVRDGLRPKRR